MNYGARPGRKGASGKGVARINAGHTDARQRVYAGAGTWAAPGTAAFMPRIP
jgi:hypothetical protein